jgi:hypothetical protein
MVSIIAQLRIYDKKNLQAGCFRFPLLPNLFKSAQGARFARFFVSYLKSEDFIFSITDKLLPYARH